MLLLREPIRAPEAQARSWRMRSKAPPIAALRLGSILLMLVWTALEGALLDHRAPEGSRARNAGFRTRRVGVFGNANNPPGFVIPPKVVTSAAANS